MAPELEFSAPLRAHIVRYGEAQFIVCETREDLTVIPVVTQLRIGAIARGSILHGDPGLLKHMYEAAIRQFGCHVSESLFQKGPATNE
jgi:hypothetical protein